MTIKDELFDRKQVQESLGAQTNLFLQEIEEGFAYQEVVISELREQLVKLNSELTEKAELLRAYDEEEKRWKGDKKTLQEQLDDVRRNRDRFKTDSKDNRSNIKELEVVIDEYERILEEILATLSVLPQRKLLTDHPMADTSREVVPTITGVFVCRGDDMREDNQRKFEKLTTMVPRVKFAEPVFIRGNSPDRPPVPEVDLVILFSRGIPHPDADAVRNVVRQKTQSSLISGLSVPLIALEVNKWMQNLEATATSRV